MGRTRYSAGYKAEVLAAYEGYYLEWVFDKFMRDPKPENPRALLPAAWVEARQSAVEISAEQVA